MSIKTNHSLKWQEIIDKKAITDDLTELFVEYQYRLDHPMPTPEDTTFTSIEMYRNDVLFRRKVECLVAGVMHVLSKHT